MGIPIKDNTVKPELSGTPGVRTDSRSCSQKQRSPTQTLCPVLHGLWGHSRYPMAPKILVTNGKFMTPDKPNLFDLPHDLSDDEEHLDLLAIGTGIRVERIVSRGHSTPQGQWYDQDQPEWVALLSGQATLQWEDGTETTLQAGDWLFIEAHRRHRVTATSSEPPCVWLAIHGDLRRP